MTRWGRVNSKHQTIGSVTLSIGYTDTNADTRCGGTMPSGQIITYSYTGIIKLVDRRQWHDADISGIAYIPFRPCHRLAWQNATQTSRSFHLDGHLTMINSCWRASHLLVLR